MPKSLLAAELARWVVNLQYEDLPSAVVLHARRCMLDTLGVQIRGATLPWIQPVYRYVRTLDGRGDATIIYHGDRLSAPYAAYANSTFSYCCELQHSGWKNSSPAPGVVVVSTVQSLGEKLGADGHDIITAMAAGYEIQGRLGLALFEPLMHRGLHPPSMLGVFSAAAASGKLLGLDEGQMAHAFSIAGSHASGTIEWSQAGGEVKRIHGAMAVRSGMQSAFLAKEGFTGPPAIFEGRHGIFPVFAGGEADPEQVAAELGQPYCITQCRFRIYPTVGDFHRILDLLERLTAENTIESRNVDSVRIGVNEHMLSGELGNITRPTDVISAQFSLAYSVGVRLVKGRADLEMFINPQLWQDPEILSMVDKVQSYPLAQTTGGRMVRVEIKLNNGQVFEGEQEYAKGSPELPLTQQDIETKFRQLAGAVLSKARVEQIVNTIAHLEDLSSMSKLASLSVKE